MCPNPDEMEGNQPTETASSSQGMDELQRQNEGSAHPAQSILHNPVLEVSYTFTIFLTSKFSYTLFSCTDVNSKYIFSLSP